MEQDIVLLDNAAHQSVLQRVRSAMAGKADLLLLTDNANIYYLTGRVIDGYILVGAEGPVRYFVRRPLGLTGNGVTYIRKPEDIPQHLDHQPGGTIALELDTQPWSMVERLKKVFPGAQTIANASDIMRHARAVKTPAEIELIRRSGISHKRVYSLIPSLYRQGMTDIELQVEIERTSRLEGCLGIFRIAGQSMEFFMGNLLTGTNADTPSPYDFAMGGAGADPSLPVGADGEMILPGHAVMVDMNGNYTGYMTDMTRVFALGTLPEKALRAHQCSIDIHRRCAALMTPGRPARQLWEAAEEIVRQANLYEYFMGHRQKAGFIGHGVGIEINELPVIAPRSRDILEVGNVIALEPKFVIPGVGAVGIENTYAITPEGPEQLTTAPEEIISLES